MTTFRLVKIFEADSIEDAIKNEKKHKPIKVEELEEEEKEFIVGYGRR